MTLAERPERPAVGRQVPHESGDLHTTGLALYTDDLVGRYAGTLHAWPLQAPFAHARIVRLDTTAAAAVPGVVRVLTAADVPGVNDAGVKHDEPLFPDEVMFHGHAVAWVLGETPEAARLGVPIDDLVLPTRDVAVVAAVDLGGGVRVEIVHLGRGHTDGDLLIDIEIAADAPLTPPARQAMRALPGVLDVVEE